MNRSAIIAIVRQKMDEVTAFSEAIIDNVDLIDPSLDEAAKKLLLAVPLHLVTPEKFDVTSLVKLPPDYVTGYIKLPLDFLRLHTFKMKQWLRVVNTPIDQLNPLYNLQKNKFTRGGIAKPVCVIAWRSPEDSESSTSSSGSGGPLMQPDPNAPFKVLEYYSVVIDPDTPNNHVVEMAYYIPVTLPENMTDNLIDPLCWLTAGDVYTILNMSEQANICYQHVKEFINENSL